MDALVTHHPLLSGPWYVKSNIAFFLRYIQPMKLLAALALGLAASAVHAQDPAWRPPFITTPSDVVERMLELARAAPGDLVIDLGSGDGRIVIAAARRFGARGLGIELDQRLVDLSRENARRAGVADRVAFAQGDVLVADISSASVVTVYLLPDLMGQLQSRFVDELKPGTRIVSHSFAMAGWKPDRSETMRVAQRHLGQGDESTLYLWVVPADVRGIWQGGGRRLRIEQNYQQIEVEGATGATLSGNEIGWDFPEGRFRGRVDGGRMLGELRLPSGAVPLELRRGR
jgi:protein-L-isoaspartate O-methyltransferase